MSRGGLGFELGLPLLDLQLEASVAGHSSSGQFEDLSGAPARHASSRTSPFAVVVVAVVCQKEGARVPTPGTRVGEAARPRGTWGPAVVTGYWSSVDSSSDPFDSAPTRHTPTPISTSCTVGLAKNVRMANHMFVSSFLGAEIGPSSL